MSDARRILLIDDEMTQYTCVRDMLSEFRTETFELDWAPTFNDGLRALNSGRHCACLLDYKLGSRTGLELLAESARMRCTTPIIMMTGMSDHDLDMKALAAGAIDYLDKTEISPRSLERCIRYALKLSESLRSLHGLATHDPLTGLLNRRELDRVLLEEFTRATRFRRCFAVILVDIDHFKVVNDTHGHQTGDIVLMHVASIIASQARATDKVARFGGEEFALIELETDETGALASAERIRAALEACPCQVPGVAGGLRITLSAGVASYPKIGDGAESLLRAADRALYEAKALGRNLVVGASNLKG